MNPQITITQFSGIYCLRAEQLLKTNIEATWQFFCSPLNLEKITPGDVKFNITSGADANVYPGKIITYELQIFPLIKTKWITEISFMSHQQYFIDDQLNGPYRLWHHEHHFKQLAEGVHMTDIVHYKLPFGSFGNLLAGKFVEKKLYKIFNYRYLYLKGLF